MKEQLREKISEKSTEKIKKKAESTYVGEGGDIAVGGVGVARCVSWRGREIVKSDSKGKKKCNKSEFQ